MFKLAGERGVGPACANLGEMFRLGLGLPAPRPADAKLWHAKAAALGEAHSQRLLADDREFS